MSIAKLKKRIHDGKYDGIFTRNNGDEIEVYYLTENEVSVFLPDTVDEVLAALEIPCEYFYKNETILINTKDRGKYEKSTAN